MSHDEICFMPATELAARIRQRELSPVEVMEAVLGRAEALQPTLNLFTALLPDTAMDGAREAEAAVMRGDATGALHGVPVTVKDMVLTRGIRTMFGSHIHAHDVPEIDAPMVERLRRAGALVFGKTTTPEFGWKAVTDSPVTGITRNPWAPAYSPGGSSGGAAGAVAAGAGPLATGGDGAGSIRIPASFSGVFGIKPQFGRIPAYPVRNGGQLAHLGPLTRTVGDAALFLSVTAGPDDRDRFSLEAPPADYTAALDAGVAGLRIAWSADLGYVDNLDPEVRRICESAVQAFEAAGAIVETIDDPGFGDPKPIIDVFWRGNFATLVGPHLDRFRDRLDPGLLACAEEGLRLGPLDYTRAQCDREDYYFRVLPFFGRYDLLLTPAVAVPPLPAGDLLPPGMPAHDWDWIRWAPYSFPFNLTHLPAASLPAGRTEGGLPVGLQVVGPRFGEPRVLAAAAAYESLRPWAQDRPPPITAP